jgi:hypothetical protein
MYLITLLNLGQKLPGSSPINGKKLSDDSYVPFCPFTFQMTKNIFSALLKERFKNF